MGKKTGTRNAPKKKSLKSLLKRYESLSEFEAEGGRAKVKCALTGHEMPATVDAVQSYISGRRYKRAVWQAFDYSKYEPWLVANGKDERLLWCTLSKRAVNKIPEDVEKHVNGRRFKRLKAAAEAEKARREEAKASKEAARLARLASLVRLVFLVFLVFLCVTACVYMRACACVPLTVACMWAAPTTTTPGKQAGGRGYRRPGQGGHLAPVQRSRGR